MARLVQWTLDVRDVEVMARFWSAVLGYRVDMGEGNEFCVLRRDPRQK